jgi:hypothetical protein
MKGTLDAFLARTLFVPIAAVRPYLVLKLTLLLVAFDMWLTRIEHGGRYSAGGFNVSHFAILDAIQPQVSSGVYVGVSILTGLLCFVLALAPRPPRWLIAIAFLLHTWSWAMSMLDSYQHHYLLSIVLFALIFFPRATAEEALLALEKKADPEPEPAPVEERREEKKAKKDKKKKRAEKPAREEKKRDEKRHDAPYLFTPPPLSSAWAYVLMSVSAAIVYAYTAYSKTADEWLSGDAFKRVLRLAPDGSAPQGVEDYIAPVRDFATMFGIEGPSFWWFMGHSVVIVQIICCAGYLLAPFLDVSKNPYVRAFSFVALATALSFHLGAEYMELKIGWFSWYMVGYAFLFFLPAEWIAVVARVLIPLEGRAFAIEALAARIALGILLLIGVTYWTPLGVVGGALLAVGFVRPLLKANEGALTKLPGYVFVVAPVIGAAALVAAGWFIDLPGARVASIFGAVGLGVAVILFFFHLVPSQTVHAYGVGAAIGATLFYVAIVASPVRYDFYRLVGGYQRRLGEPAMAYVSYVKANRYAPEGEGRRAQELRLRRQLSAQGPLPPVERE